MIAWMAVAMLPWATVLPMLAKVGQHQLALNRSAPPTTQESYGEAEVMAVVLKEGITATFVFSVASMFIAAVCTVMPIIVSRRATLRQVNARLREISLQIKNLGSMR